MIDIDTSITHVTNGNVFADLGFSPEEAEKLKIKVQLMCLVSE